jgi:hypothetical protein
MLPLDKMTIAEKLRTQGIFHRLGNSERTAPQSSEMRILALPSARDDFSGGFEFYERKQAGLGDCFLESLFSDIESLRRSKRWAQPLFTGPPFSPRC